MGCIHQFDPVIGSQAMADVIPDVRFGETYWQSRTTVDVDGICKRLIGRTVVGLNGNLEIRSCNCDTALVIPCKPIMDRETRDTIMQEIPVVPTIECRGFTLPEFIEINYPCVIDTPAGSRALMKRDGDAWPGAPRMVAQFMNCWGGNQWTPPGAMYRTSAATNTFWYFTFPPLHPFQLRTIEVIFIPNVNGVTGAWPILDLPSGDFDLDTEYELEWRDAFFDGQLLDIAPGIRFRASTGPFEPMRGCFSSAEPWALSYGDPELPFCVPAC